jgi:hypothetical protein
VLEVAKRVTETFYVLVPCCLVEQGRHEIEIVAGRSVRISGCEERTADAAERLGGLTCLLTIKALRLTLDGEMTMWLASCPDCRALVLPLDRTQAQCPICKRDHLRLGPEETGFWAALLRGSAQRRGHQRQLGHQETMTRKSDREITIVFETKRHA